MTTMQATSVTYKGLPQNDWEKYSKSTPMSPQAAQKASRRLTAFMMVLLVVFGFSAAILIPMILSKSEILDLPLESSQAPLPYHETEPKASLFDDYYYDYDEDKPLHKDKDVKDDKSKEKKKEPNEKMEATTKKVGPKLNINPKVTTHKGSAVTESHSQLTTKTTTRKPTNGTSFNKKTTATSKMSKFSRTTKEKVTPTMGPQHPSTTTPNPHKGPRSSSAALQKLTATSTAPSEISEGLSENSNSTSIISKIINAIYSRNQNATSGPISDEEIREWINDLITNQPNVVVAVLGTSAVFVGLICLMVSVICVRQRRKAANRRMKIKDVVTDLQASDKVVLLSSDLSEEE